MQTKNIVKLWVLNREDKMAINDSDRKARANYKKKIKRVFLELYGTDEDIKQRLDKVKAEGEPVSTYIKRLIREDIEKRG